jgi:hypothetical protein
MFSLCFVKESADDDQGLVLYRYTLADYNITHDNHRPHLNLLDNEREKFCQTFKKIKSKLNDDDVVAVYLCEDLNLSEIVGLVSVKEICEEITGEIIQDIELANLSLSA